MLRRSNTCAAIFFLLAPCICDCFYATDQQQDLIRRIDSAELLRENKLAGYTVTEYYTIKNSHISRPAEAIVQTTYKRGEGKTYKVLSRTGPSLLRNTVLDRLLQDEGEMSRGRARELAIITSANYKFRLIGTEPVGGILCDVIELNPKRKSPYVLKGRMWVRATDMNLVKIEGRPPTSASFFAGRPQVVREYKQIDGFPLAQDSHAVSEGFFLGKSTVDIEYRDYHVIASKS